jgi:hypothetical protein
MVDRVKTVQSMCIITLGLLLAAAAAAPYLREAVCQQHCCQDLPLGLHLALWRHQAHCLRP